MSKGGAPKGNQNHFKHGLAHTRIDNIYKTMISRCYNSNDTKFLRYGKRGIKVCDEWKSDRTAFYKWAFHNGYSEELSIDRIDNDGNYEPNNCRWVDAIAQANNKSSNKHILFNGRRLTIAEWSRELGINYQFLWAKLNKGFDLEQIIETRRRNANTNRHERKGQGYTEDFEGI